MDNGEFIFSPILSIIEISAAVFRGGDFFTITSKKRNRQNRLELFEYFDVNSHPTNITNNNYTLFNT